MDVDDEDLPATDALRLAEPAGVNLSKLGALAVSGDRHDAVWVHDPQLRLRRSEVALREVPEGRWVAVPVFPSRRSRAETMADPTVIAALGARGSALLDLLATVDRSEPVMVKELSVWLWPAAPVSHEGHEGRRCEISGSQRCWSACVDTVLEAAEVIADRWWLWGASSPELLVPPLLSRPCTDPATARRCVASVESRLLSVLGDVSRQMLFMPSPVRQRVPARAR